MLRYLASRIDAIVPYVNRRSIFDGEPSRSTSGLQFLELDNCRVRYLVRGEGRRTIVLAPDSPVTMKAHEELVEALSSHHHVVLFETPAFGFSVPKPNFDFGFDAWTATIAELLRRLVFGPYGLAIPCVAGPSGIAIARKHPELVEAIVSTQTPNWARQRRWVRSWDDVDARGVMTWPFWSQLLGFWAKTRVTHLCHKRITQQRRDELMAISLKTLRQRASNPLMTACQCYLTLGPPGWLGAAKQPSISIWGTADRSHVRCGTDRRSIHECLPNAELVDFDDAGHFLEAEVAAKFGEVVLRFVDSLPPTRAH